jgi:hypothetical protein
MFHAMLTLHRSTRTRFQEDWLMVCHFCTVWLKSILGAIGGYTGLAQHELETLLTRVAISSRESERSALTAAAARLNAVSSCFAPITRSTPSTSSRT